MQTDRQRGRGAPASYLGFIGRGAGIAALLATSAASAQSKVKEDDLPIVATGKAVNATDWNAASCVDVSIRRRLAGAIDYYIPRYTNHCGVPVEITRTYQMQDRRTGKYAYGSDTVPS